MLQSYHYVHSYRKIIITLECHWSNFLQKMLPPSILRRIELIAMSISESEMSKEIYSNALPQETNFHFPKINNMKYRDDDSSPGCVSIRKNTKQISKRQSFPRSFIFFSAVFYLLHHFWNIFLWHLTSGIVYKSCQGLEIYFDLLIWLLFF